MACGGELYRARPWTILIERKMRSRFMMILKIARQDAAQVTLAEDDDVIQTFAADRDIGAVAGGAQRDREPDAPRSASDEESLSFERHRRHRLRAKNASKAAFASGECRRSLKILASRSMRASNSSVAPRVRARESATAPGGSAAISRAAFKPSVSTSSGATTMLAMPNSLACVALSGRP